jgi:hypothetical protein
MKRPLRLSWVGLVTLLLLISLFIPVEASTPSLQADASQQLRRTCSPDIVINAAGWGTCNDINCCGGPPEAECRPAAM